MKVLITDGGAHPPETWAVATAEHIFPTDGVKDGNRLIAAKKLQTAIAEALVPHHHDVQHYERGKLAKSGDDHLDTDLAPEAHVDDAILAVRTAAVGTPWEDHFARADVETALRQEIGNHFATAQHIERQWHCRGNKSAKARAWLEAHHPEELKGA